jgi:hypothetical protein
MAPLRLPSLTLALLLAIGLLSPASAGVRLGTISAGAGTAIILRSIWFPRLTRDKSACRAPIKMQKSTWTMHTQEPLPR